MSDAALAQRRNASQSARESSTGPVTKEGKAASSRNSWKDGTHAKTIARQVRRPCLSTCEHYATCEFVGDGLTTAGGDCLHREEFVRSYFAVMEALIDGKYENINQLAAAQLALHLTLHKEMGLTILDHGPTIYEEQFNKDGDQIGKKLKEHPLIPSMVKSAQVLGLTMTDFKLTPKSQGDEAGSGKTVAEMLAAGLATVGKLLPGGGK